MKLSIGMMTRGRPEVMAECVKRTLPNIVLENTSLVLLVDEDDPESADALKSFTSDSRVILSVKPREDSRGLKYDRILTEAPADVYLPTCDYAPLLTKGFDKLILEAAQRFPDGIGCVYTCLANVSFPHYQGVTAKLVEKMGYIYPPWFPFWFIDHWLDDLSRMIDRISFADVAVDGVSLFTGKTIGLRDLNFWTCFYDVGMVERHRQARAIIDGDDFIDPQWRKEILRTHNDLIDRRGFFINQGVRNSAEALEQQRGGAGGLDEIRYQRVKQRAMVLMSQWYGDLIEELKAKGILIEERENAA